MLLLFIKDVKTVLCVDRLTERSTVVFFLKKLLIEMLSNHHNQQLKNNTIQKKILKKKCCSTTQKLSFCKPSHTQDQLHCWYLSKKTKHHQSSVFSTTFDHTGYKIQLTQTKNQQEINELFSFSADPDCGTAELLICDLCFLKPYTTMFWLSHTCLAYIFFS